MNNNFDFNPLVLVSVDEALEEIFFVLLRAYQYFLWEEYIRICFQEQRSYRYFYLFRQTKELYVPFWKTYYQDVSPRCNRQFFLYRRRIALISLKGPSDETRRHRVHISRRTWSRLNQIQDYVTNRKLLNVILFSISSDHSLFCRMIINLKIKISLPVYSSRIVNQDSASEDLRLSSVASLCRSRLIVSILTQLP